MNNDLSNFAARMREIIVAGDDATGLTSDKFNELALELFAFQFAHNVAYRRICEGRKLTPARVEHWTQIPFVPTSAFKELELTSLASNERTAVFHSSGTTEQKPSRHFHNADSLKLYEASVWAGFSRNILQKRTADSGQRRLICLTPPPGGVPHSSLVHMFETVRRILSAPETVFVGQLDVEGAWRLNFDSLLNVPGKGEEPRLFLGTAFSFVHLVDFLAEKNLRLQLPPGSRVMETGGYKNRSRTMPKAELHALITEHLGVSAEDIICEYGMSELSSQAYDFRSPGRFFFPPWARAQIISPEDGREVAEGETGLIRILDLANVFSVAAVQTEDLESAGAMDLSWLAAQSWLRREDAH